MAEYIERKEAIDVVEFYASRQAARVILKVPAADVAPVVHGCWVKHTKMHGFVYCSACRDVYLDAEWLADGKWKFCPNCGAKMDGDSNA